jgi:hypothetical protein
MKTKLLFCLALVLNGGLSDGLNIARADENRTNGNVRLSGSGSLAHIVLSPSSRSVESFRFIKAGTTIEEVIAKLGEPNVSGSGGPYNLYIYPLGDGSDVFVGSSEDGKILFVTHGKEILFGNRMVPTVETARLLASSNRMDTAKRQLLDILKRDPNNQKARDFLVFVRHYEYREALFKWLQNLKKEDAKRLNDSGKITFSWQKMEASYPKAAQIVDAYAETWRIQTEAIHKLESKQMPSGSARHHNPRGISVEKAGDECYDINILMHGGSTGCSVPPPPLDHVP